MRVLVCGNRTWAYDGVAVYSPPKPAYDMCMDARMITDMLTGMYAEHMVGFGSAHLTPFTLIEGGASGADSVAWWWAESSPMHAPSGEDTGYGDPEFVHLHFPADWDRLGKRAGFVRNRQMLVEGRPDIVLAYTHDYGNSRGTRMMVELADKAGVPTYVIG